MTDADQLFAMLLGFICGLTWISCAYATGQSIRSMYTEEPSKFKLTIFWIAIYFIWPSILIRNFFDMVATKLTK